MKKIFVPLLLGIVILWLSGCASSKEILYFQNIEQTKPKEMQTKYETKIKKDDVLSIVVSGPDKMVVQPYNLSLSEGSTNTSYNPENSILKYTVDSEGCIDFPILGKIKVEGMTRSELVNYLTQEISKDVKDPIVYVKITNYKVTILGEVKSPGTYNINTEKINVLEALGIAGDLLLTAQRDNIILIREIDGKQEHFKINLKNSSILSSPYFYLQQNDVIYVPQSPSRVAQGTMATGLWSIIFSSITTIVTVISLILANS
ncbi:MAG: polysaccharide biosynthesis/export family protein [Bacteroidales bacterium]